jgi:hypothetical protein
MDHAVPSAQKWFVVQEGVQSARVKWLAELCHPARNDPIRERSV